MSEKIPKIPKTIRYILAFTWELPQTLVALFCMLILDCKKLKETEHNISIYRHYNDFLTWWSLGEFVFVKGAIPEKANPDGFKHELGHSTQSLILGPLYLILIALPSAIWNLFSRVSKWCYNHYYDTPWEAWADKLGGVTHKKK